MSKQTATKDINYASEKHEKHEKQTHVTMPLEATKLEMLSTYTWGIATKYG